MPSNKSSRQRIQAIRRRPRKARQARSAAPNTSQLNPLEALNQVQQDLQGVQKAKSGLSDLVPYNPRLLNRSRTQLQLGDWEKLADLDEHELEHNPAAAELRLLAAAGHLQKGGEQAKARAHTLLETAIEAGLDRESVARILIGGASNTLGRLAALSNRPEETVIRHFRSAISISVPAADADLLLQPAVSRQLDKLARACGRKSALQTSHCANSKSKKLQVFNKKSCVFVPAEVINSPFEIEAEKAFVACFEEQRADLKRQFERQAKDLARFRAEIDRGIKKEITTATKQFKDFLRLQCYFESGRIVGDLNGWPISPDLAFYLIEQIEVKSYDAIIEFGSGTSTQLIARAVGNAAQSQLSKQATIQVAYEHLEPYHRKTLALLTQSGLADKVCLCHAPLTDFMASDGAQYSFYDCSASLENISKELPNPTPTILVFVDGPPAKTCTHARYPALPMVLKYFPHASIDFILDDYNRQEEQEVANKWERDLMAVGIQFEKVVEDFDKGACKFAINDVVKR